MRLSLLQKQEGGILIEHHQMCSLLIRTLAFFAILTLNKQNVMPGVKFSVHDSKYNMNPTLLN